VSSPFDTVVQEERSRSGSSSLCHGRRSIGAAARPARARGFSPQNGDETAIDSGYKGLARHKSPAQRRLSG